MSLRIGCVKYLNARPLIHGWAGPVVFDHPAILSRMLAEGELDVAFVSSFEYLRNPIYAIADRVAVASDGPVHSVFVTHQGAIEALEEIALDPASQSSVNLLRCLLAENNLRPQLIENDRELAVRPRCGQLMIGDQAIRFRERHKSDYDFWDLGAAWQQATGLPFVFALWLIRPETQQAAQIAQLLRDQRDQNLARLDDLIATQPDFTANFCASYFRGNLRFSFGEREQEGLFMFRSLCEKHGILPRKAAPLRLI